MVGTKEKDERFYCSLFLVLEKAKTFLVVFSKPFSVYYFSLSNISGRILSSISCFYH